MAGLRQLRVLVPHGIGWQEPYYPFELPWTANANDPLLDLTFPQKDLKKSIVNLAPYAAGWDHFSHVFRIDMLSNLRHYINLLYNNRGDVNVEFPLENNIVSATSQAQPVLESYKANGWKIEELLFDYHYQYPVVPVKGEEDKYCYCLNASLCRHIFEMGPGGAMFRGPRIRPRLPRTCQGSCGFGRIW